MTTLRQTEPSANNALGAILRRMLPSCAVHSETTRAIIDHPGLQPDILITAIDRAPVVIEAEYMPAYTAEDEAKARLGLQLADGGRRIEAAIALRYPTDVANASDLDSAIRSARLEYAVFYEDETRFPASGWISGGVSDIADLIRLVSVSESEVDAAADILEQGIDRAVAILNDIGKLRPAITQNIARLLGDNRDLLSTRRMACAVIANALIFHERVAGMHPEVETLDLLWDSPTDNPKSKISAAWDDVLQINYWAIFAIARDIVNQIPASKASTQILDKLRDTAQRINSGGAIFAHNLTGRTFHRLIADRKYLATFYTLPESAALLARLAVAKLNGVDWASADDIGKLRVGDFACGTGALLSAVYEQIANRHENAGGDPAALHSVMMAEALYGCDVVSSAIHITGSTLSGMQPNMPYENTQLYTLAFGRQRDGSVNIGSLELLKSSSGMALFNTNDPALRTGSRGEETAGQVIVDIPDDGFDLVIMNPPFTRATNHEGARRDVVNPAFAAFEASKADMDAMGKRMRDLGKASCYDGKAGIASAFVALADRKLKPGGVLAFVLPLSAASGASWQKFRQMLARDYTDLEVCSIAANGKEMSFSFDTGMAECLVVARKMREDEESESAVKFISLTRRPDDFLQASEIAKSILDANDDARGIEDGPYGGTPLNIGTEQVGELLETPSLPYERGDGWGAVRIKDYSLTQTAYALSQSQLRLPNRPAAAELKVALLTSVGSRGLVHRLIVGPPNPAPFEKVPPSSTATYPALWNHNAKNETRIVCEPDSQLLVRKGMEDQAGDVWQTAGRCHINLDFTFGSQPLAVAFTEHKAIGGRIWPNVNFVDERFDYAFTIWGNSTLGLLSWWWHSNRQQSSKASITVTMLETLPILDLRALSDAQLATAQEIFDEFRELELQPAYLADADANRALLDRRVVCDMLGFDDAVYEGVRMLAAKWCAEPSVHGGKRRPAEARLVL